MRPSIYKAPDGFFEELETGIANKTGAIRSRRRKIAGATLAVAALTVVFIIMPFRFPSDEMDTNPIYDEEEILSTYDYDIFLNTYQL